MSTERIARRTVGFYLLTSLANIGGVIAFAGLYAVGILDHDRNSTLTYASGAASAAATGIVLALPWLLESRGRGARLGKRSDRLAAVVRLARCSLAQGVRDAVVLLRQRSIGVLAGSFGTLAFDIAVLGVTFKAFGYSPPLGVLVLGYLIGQLGGNLPLPGGIGSVDAGLIGIFALYHQPLAPTTAAVLVYHAIALWIRRCLAVSRSCSCAAGSRVKPAPPRSARRWSSRDHSGDQLVADRSLFRAAAGAERFQAM